MTEAQPYDNLTPDLILDAIESVGLGVSGSLFPLNSYENRVYQVGLNTGNDIISKFYRPGRWSNEAILEEHRFSRELADNEIPVVAPLEIDGKTLFDFEGYRFAVFEKRGGRSPELENPDHLRWLGRFLGRIHAVGRSQFFQHRPRLTPQRLGNTSVSFLLDSGFIPDYLQHNYRVAAEAILEVVSNHFEACLPRYLRIHGDCHPGNILWTDDGPHFVDLDDTCMGPAIQDLWMLLSGDRQQMETQLRTLLEGYHTFSDFDEAELILIEPLRALRQLHYSAWLARRWNDPAFPMHFPWFNTPRYWEEHLNDLRECQERLAAPELRI
ncbi:MAG: serine/threonine protein kinase [Thioalkalispiraceae bacterium]|jgi:Ser/Thr protein kinase RdoA (MazF antagonist)